MCLGDKGVSTKVRGREEVTHASQGCDMPGSRQRSRWLSREHTHSSTVAALLGVCVFVCESVSCCDRPFKGKGKQTQSQPPLLLAGVAGGEQGLSGEAGHRQSLNGSVML